MTLGSRRTVGGAPARRRGWFISPAVDIWFVFGVGAVLAAAVFAATADKSVFIVVAVLFAVLSDYPHVLQTTARIWLDPRERARHGRHYAVSLMLFGAAVSAMMFSHHIAVLAAVWAYWQILHVLKQHFGIMNIYAAKNGYRGGPRRLAKYTLFAGCLAPVLYRAGLGFRFSDYVVFGYRLPFSNLRVPTPPIPWPVVVAGYAIFAVLLVLFVREQRRRARVGERVLPGMALATMACAIVSYNLSYLLVSDLFALIIIATTTHSLQYHLINWVRNSTRFEPAADPAQRGLLLARLSRPRALPLYMACFAVAGAVTGQVDTVLLGVIPLTLVFHHFYLDGVIWKGKGNPELVYDLGIAVRPGGMTTPDATA